MKGEETLFEFTTHGPDGKTVRGTVRAENEAAAFQKASKSGSTITGLRRAGDRLGNSKPLAERKVQIDLLRQFAIMIGAHVDAGHALAALRAASSDPPIRKALEEAEIQLRGGASLSQCLQIGVPGLSANIVALINAGEKGGCLAVTANHAVAQLEAEERIATTLKGAMIYPLFLTIAGLLASTLMLTMVIPRFALLLGDERANLSGLSWAIFKLGDIASQSFGLVILLPTALLGLLLVRAFRSSASGTLARHLPVISGIYKMRERERWCRIMSVALASRIGILEAMNLASASQGDPSIHLQTQSTLRELRLGARVAEAVQHMGLLEETHLSLVRVGEDSGALSEMFGQIAQDSESQLQEQLKRATVVIEQLVTVSVSGLIGLIVYGLVSSLTSIYGAIGQ
ncbi:type II secretion system F family protein [Novosphingobium sp. MW5]|nr:type II secretion system F family protein [Novosphingobium sp. MW5]